MSRLDEEEGEELITLLPPTCLAIKKDTLKAPAGNISVGSPLGLHSVVYHCPFQVKATDVYNTIPFAVSAGGSYSPLGKRGV